MNLSSRSRIFLLCVACCLPQGIAQQQPLTTPKAMQPGVAQSSNPADSRLVFDVVVADKAGNGVAGLEEKDFTLLDNGHPQKILSFHATGGGAAAANSQPAEPIKIILLVDEVNTDFRKVSFERDQIKRLLLQNGGALAHPVSMAFFSDTDTEIQENSSTDGNTLLAAFDQHQTGLRSIRRSQGYYGAVERLQLSLKTLSALVAKEGPIPGRKLVIWISPGWPLLSGPNVQLDTRQQAGLFASIVSASTSLREARITLYNVNPEGAEDAGSIQAFYYEEFLKPVTAQNRAQTGNLALQVLAVQSGGQALTPSNDIAKQIDHCITDADVYYTLTVNPVPADKPNEFHAIEVKVATPGLKARTRAGYYTQP
jgi:VWFA-related protein